MDEYIQCKWGRMSTKVNKEGGCIKGKQLALSGRGRTAKRVLLFLDDSS